MAKRTTIVTEVAKVAEEAGNDGVSGSVGSNTHYRDLGHPLKKRQRARRIEALSLKLAGVSTAQIAERMGIAPDSVRKLIDRTPDGGEPGRRGDACAGSTPGWTAPRLPSGPRS